MRIAFPSDDNQFLMPTQQRSYTRVTDSAPIIIRSVTALEMALSDLGVQITRGAGTAAAEAVLEAGPPTK